MNRKPYPTDLTDEQRAMMMRFLPSDAPTGRPRRLSLREIMNAVIHTVRAGCHGVCCRMIFRHVALASYYNCRFLLTWNCQNLANINKFEHIRHINTLLGLFVPISGITALSRCRKRIKQ